MNEERSIHTERRKYKDSHTQLEIWRHISYHYARYMQQHKRTSETEQSKDQIREREKGNALVANLPKRMV